MAHRRAPMIGLLILMAAAMLATPAFAEEDVPVITSTPHSEWTRDIEYFQSQTFEGGTGIHRWEISSGTLPPGLSLSEEGVLSGTPTVAGEYDFTIKLRDEIEFFTTLECTLLINDKASIPADSPIEWTDGSELTHQFEAVGGTGTIEFEITEGELPDGLSLNADGHLSGTPETHGDYRFTVSAEDSLGSVGIVEIDLGINAAPDLAEFDGDTWTINRDYGSKLGVSGGTAPFSWTVTGDLPYGLTGTVENSVYSISGTPGTAGKGEITIEVEDSTGAVASTTIMFTINDWPTLDHAELPDRTENCAISEQLPIEGGTGPYSFRVIEGRLPSGVRLDEKGALTGMPVENGAFGFKLEAVDTAGATAVQDFNLNVNPALEIVAPTLPEWTVGLDLDPAIFSLHGGTGTASFGNVSGLPAGVEFGQNGVLSGNPSVNGTFNLTIEAEDELGAVAKHELVWVVNAAPAFEAVELSDWTRDQDFAEQIGCAGGTAPLSWELVDGSVPNGLSLEMGSSLAKLAGAPSAAGSYDLSIRVTDANGAEAIYSASIVINDRPAIATTTLPDWSAGHLFSQVLETTGGTAPLSLRIAGGNLPEGLELSADGLIAGTTAATGQHEFAVELMDACGAKSTLAMSMKINAAPAFEADLPEWTADIAFEKDLTSTGGTGEIEWSIASGALPNGISLSTAGRIYGEPQSDGVHTFTVRTTDETGATTDHECSWTINPALDLIQGTVRPWTIGKFYHAKLRAAGGTAPFSWEMTSGSLPEGIELVIDGEWAHLNGTPTQAASSTFSLQVTDGVGAIASRSFSLTINGGVDLAADAALVCAVDRNVDLELPVSGGTAPYTSYIHKETPLPAGLTLDQAEQKIIGRTYVPGEYPIVVTVRDAAGVSVTLETSLHVAAEVYFREKRSGALADNDNQQYLFFDAIAGTTVNLTLQFGRGQGNAPVIDVLQDGSRVNMPAAKMKTSSSKWSVRNFEVPTTGRYFVRIDNEAAGYEGDFKVRSRAKMPKQVEINGNADAPVNADECDFFLLPGCQIALDLDTNDSRIDSGDLYLVSPTGEKIFLSDDLSGTGGKYKSSPDGDSATASKITLPEGGQYRLHVALTSQGSFEGRIRINAPRQYRFVMDD